GDDRRDRDRPPQLRDVPLPARLGLRAALRRAARRLAARGRPLHARPRLRLAGRAARTARGLGDRLLPLPVALAAGAALVDRPRRAHASGSLRLHSLAPELRRGVLPRRAGGAPLPPTTPRLR